MIKKILIILVAVVIIALVIGFALPRHTRVQRSVLIERPASLVFATIDSFQLFPLWSPWQDLDPTMRQSMQGPRDGVGAKLVWSGNKKVGSGTQLITAVVPDQSVASDLDFGSMQTAKSVLTLTPQGASTQVTWTVDMDMGANPIAHYFGLMMDGKLGKDFASGLHKLKTLVESMPNVDIAGFTAETVQLASTPLLVITESVERSASAIGQAYDDGFGQIRSVMAKNKLLQAGAPLGIEREASGSVYIFEAGVPVAAAAGGTLPLETPANQDGVKLAASYGGKALKATHVGGYAELAKTQAKFRAFMAAHGYTPTGQAISWFVDDPEKIPQEKVRTEIYAPIG